MVSRRVLQGVVISLWIVMMFCLIYALIIISSHDISWQRTLLYCYLLTLAVDVIVTATLECWILHYVIPMLAFLPIRSAYQRLRVFLLYAIPEVLVFFEKSLDRQSREESMQPQPLPPTTLPMTFNVSMEDLYVIHHLASLFPWNACDELYVAHRVALQCEEVFESLLILSYHDIFPSHRLRSALRRVRGGRDRSTSLLRSSVVTPLSEDQEMEEERSNSSVSSEGGDVEDVRRPSLATTTEVEAGAVSADVISVSDLMRDLTQQSLKLCKNVILWLRVSLTHVFLLPINLALICLSKSLLTSVVKVLIPIGVIALAVVSYYASSVEQCFWLVIASVVAIAMSLLSLHYTLPLMERRELLREE
eukprot:gene30195-38905_t